MKRIIGLLALGATLSITTAALAEEVTSTIKAIDTQTRRVTLDDGKVYTTIGSINLTQLKVGDKVKVTFDPATPVFQSLGIHGSATKIAAAK
jgi:hypothetical protein